MAITINGKTYRNLQEQVKKNMDDIEELQNNIIDPDDFVSIDTDQTITGEKTFDSNINITNGHDVVASSSTAYFGSIYENGHDISDVYATKDDVYTKAEADLTFADADDVYTKSEVNEMNSDMEDYIDDKIDNVNAIIGDGYLTQLTATFGTNGNYKSVLNLGDLVEHTDYEDNGTNNTQFKINRSLYISVEKGSIITLVGYPDYSSYQIITDETTYDNLTGTTTLTALSTQVIEIKSLSSSNYYISLNVTNYIKETLTEVIDNINTAVSSKANTSDVYLKDSNGNIDGILQVEHIQSEEWDEDDDCKADIYLYSGERRSRILISSDGEETGSSITLQGTTSVGSEGTVQISGETTFVTNNRITVTDGNDDEEIAYLSDVTGAVSGVNNGTNWTSITIGNDTYGIPTGGSGSIVAGTGIDITNGVVSVDNTVAMKTDLPTSFDIQYNSNTIATNGVAEISSSNSHSSSTPRISINSVVPYLHLGNVDVEFTFPTQAKPYSIKCEDYVISPSISNPSIMFHIWLEAVSKPTTAPSWSSICSSLPVDRCVPATGQWYDGSYYYEVEGIYKMVSTASTVTIFGHKRITSGNISSTSDLITISTSSTDVHTALDY